MITKRNTMNDVRSKMSRPITDSSNNISNKSIDMNIVEELKMRR